MKITMKNIIRDYFGAYKINRRKERQTEGLSFLAAFIAMPVFAGVSGNVNFRWEYMAISIGILLPMGLSGMDIFLRSPGLSKMMYLCPMSGEERKKHIYGTYCFGVGFRIFISFLGVCPLVLFFQCDIFSAIQILLNDFLIAVLVSYSGNREERMFNKKLVLETWLIATALISNIIETGIVADEMAATDYIVKLVLFGAFIIIQLPMAVKYGKYVKQTLDDAVYYETWQRRTA